MRHRVATWLILALLAAASPAAAQVAAGDTVAVVAPSMLRQRPGAAYPATGRLPAGARLIVLRVAGGWARVSGSRGAGWIPSRALVRTRPGRALPRPAPPPVVAEPLDELELSGDLPAPEANALALAPVADPDDPFAEEELGTLLRRRRAARVEPSPEPEEPPEPAEAEPPPADGVKARELSPLLEEPSARGKPVGVVREGTPLEVLQRTPDGRWLLVRTLDGADSGWIARARVRDVDPAARALGATQLGLDASLGGAILTQTFQSASEQPLAAFRLRTVAGALGVGGLVRVRVAPRTELGGELAYRFLAASPGMRVLKEGGGTEDMAVVQHAVELGGRVGARGPGPNGPSIYARLGYRFETTRVDEAPSARLPSDSLRGPTFGAGLDVPAATEHVAAAAELRVLYPGTFVQTDGRKEGEPASAYALHGRALLGYRVAPGWTIGAIYDFARSAVVLQGPSQRLPGSQGAKRELTNHTFSIGFRHVL